MPILGENGSQGVLNVFHDKTEMRKLSDELSGARYMLDTLRFFNHEFINKLHIILGYLQTGESQKAVQFIMNTSLVTSQSIRETGGLYPGVPPVRPHHREDDARRRAGHPAHRNPRQLLPGGGPAPLPGGLCHHPGQPVGKRHRRAQPKPQRGAGDQAVHVLPPDCNLVVCEDTGGGIAPDILPHIWDKGFSSKGEGRGFGLYLISRLVDEHGGCIELETEPGVGTCFTLTFTREE